MSVFPKGNMDFTYPNSNKLICSITSLKKQEIKEKLDEIKEFNTGLIYIIILQPKNKSEESLLKIGYSKSHDHFFSQRFQCHQRGFKYKYNIFLYDVYPAKSNEYELLLHNKLKKYTGYNRRIQYVNKDYTISSSLETYRLCRSILKFISDFSDVYIGDACDLYWSDDQYSDVTNNE